MPQYYGPKHVTRPRSGTPGKLKCLTVYALRSKATHEVALKPEDWSLLQPPRTVAAPRENSAGHAYNRLVARGWESKSVELQQADVGSSTGTPKHRLTPEQRAIESRAEGLKLSRSRILEQLHSAENPRYRQILEQALGELDEQITRLG